MTDPSPSNKIKIHSIQTNSTIRPQNKDLEPILDLHRHVFGIPPDDQDPHWSLSEWQTRLARQDGILVYTTTGTPTEGTVSKSSLPQGYCFAYRHHHDQIGQDSLHIWLAGVLETARGGGHFPLMLGDLRKFAKERGLQMLSVCTYPDKFDKMYRILIKTGWILKADMGGGKVLLAKAI